MLALLIPWPAARAAGSVAPTVSVTPSLPSGQLVGTTIIWTAAAGGMTNPVYRFSVGPTGGQVAVVRDFSQNPSFAWTPMAEGGYIVQVSVKDGFDASSTTQAADAFTVNSRVKGTRAVVSSTANSLIALYSAPGCSSGSMVVQFRPATGSTPWQATAPRPCHAGQSVNVLVTGLLPDTSYLLQHVVTNGASSVASPSLTFTTGKLPTGLRTAPFKVGQPLTLGDNPAPTIFHMLVPTPSRRLANPMATDLAGHLVWYYDTLHSDLTTIWPVRILSGSTILLLGQDKYRSTGDDVLREVDLAGNPIRETNLDAVNAQLALRGQEPIYMFHHDAIRLPDGDTAVLASTQNRVAGHNIMGDMILVLDSNFQVVWTWDVFDHFTPPATFPPGVPTCLATGALCGLPDRKAIDWTHGNGLDWSAQDGNLILSLRNISLVIKIDYQNGQGRGQVLWRLGQGGDFSIRSADPFPWFSDQHNANYVDATTMAVFDDGNTRCQNGKVKGCQSRGQVYTLDEQHHVATLAVNANLGTFWLALGSAQGLSNGDFFFSGGIGPVSRETEISADGTSVYELYSPVPVYRAYRIQGMSF